MTVYSCPPHSQAADGAMLNLFKKEQKSPTPVPRRLTRTTLF